MCVEATSYGIILAGGRSQRMGQDKALLVWNGKTFLEHVVARLRLLTDDILLVADGADRYSLPGVPLVVDTYPNAGPVAGIVTGLLHAGAGIHFVVPCDMPNISVDVLNALWEICAQSWTKSEAGFEAVVPEIEGEPEPLYAVYHHAALPKLQGYLQSGRRSARGALDTLNVRRVEATLLRRFDPNLSSFQNVNTPEELARLLETTSL